MTKKQKSPYRTWLEVLYGRGYKSNETRFVQPGAAFTGRGCAIQLLVVICAVQVALFGDARHGLVASVLVLRDTIPCVRLAVRPLVHVQPSMPHK
jgi:hypothetical protein